MRKVAVIICAAGEGSRFGGKKKKQFTNVAGRAAFLRSIEFFADRDDVKQVLLAISKDDEEIVKVTHGAKLGFYGVKICFGAGRRSETVANAIELVDEDVDLIAVHDAVRCCLKKEWIDEVFCAAEKSGAALLACPVTDTLKKVDAGKIDRTVDRTGLYRAQTPQVFKADLLKKAYKTGASAAADVSDDCQLLETLDENIEITVVETDESNIKITTKTDIVIAEAIIKSRPKPGKDGPIGPYVEPEW